MKKLFVIARNDIRLHYSDRVVLTFGIIMPLTITALIHLAFGNIILGRSIPEARVPVGIVNQDRGSAWGDFGQLFVYTLTPDSTQPALLDELPLQLFDFRELSDETKAQQMVEREELVAALFIPPDFSESLAMDHASVEVYVSGRENILGLAFESVVETLANAISSGEVAIRTTVQGLIANPQTRTEMQIGKLNDAMANLVYDAVMPESNPIQIQRIPPPVQSAQIKLAHYLAATIAIMFIGFTALMVSAGLFHDKAQWTLQRAYITPTRPGIILGGKILGTYLITLIQMGALASGLAGLERLLGTHASDALGAASPPGIDLLGLVLLILAVTTAATGVGVAIAGLAGTYTHAANYGRVFLVLMGLAGGIFFPVELFPPPIDLLSRITFQYWAMDGYLKLALGGGVTSIMLHCFVLITMGVLFFAIGSRALKRRIEFLW